MNADEQYLLAIIGITASVALCLLSLLIAAAGIAVVLLLSRYGIRIIATIRHRRQRARDRAKQAEQDVDTIAEAIAQAAGHNWTANMMPEYRADFRRQASAVIATFKASRGLK